MRIVLAFMLAVLACACTGKGGPMRSSGESADNVRYFGGFSGLRHPVRLTEPLAEADTEGRLSYYRATYDDDGRPIVVEKLLNGTLEFTYRYSYTDAGNLKRATVQRAGEEEKEVSVPTPPK